MHLSPISYRQFSSQLKRSIEEVIQESGAHSESTKRKVARISFIVLMSLVFLASESPSVLTAHSFNLFPGSGIISATAVVAEAGFNIDNIAELSEVLFGAHAGEVQRMSKTKAAKLIVATLLALYSRSRGAGLTLHVAPGIAAKLRIPLALFKMAGTCFPEIVSTYNTMGMKFDRMRRVVCGQSQQDEMLSQVRSNMCQSIRTYKRRLLEMSGTKNQDMLLDMVNVLSTPADTMRIFDRVLTDENQIAAQDSRPRRWLRVITGVATTAASSCSLVLSSVLAKYAANTFIPGGDVSWKWPFAILSAGTIAYTTVTQTYKGADNLISRLLACCCGSQERTIGNTFYPKTHIAYTLLSQLFVAALFGEKFESVKGSLGLTSWPGITVLVGVSIASYFLYSQGMENLFEKGARAVGRRREADSEVCLTTKVVTKLDKIEELINSASLEDIGRLLQDLTPTQKALLLSGVKMSAEPFDDADEERPLLNPASNGSLAQ